MSNMGEWYITVVDANCVKGFDLFSKSDLYAKINFNGKTVKTKTVKQQESPIWNETFAFPFNSNHGSDVEIKVSDEDVFKDDTITVANINYKQFPSFGEEKEYSIPLSYKNKDIGILHIRMRNGGKNMGGYNNNNYSSQQYPSSTLPPDNRGGYDSTVLGGHSYHDTSNHTRNMNIDNNTNTHIIYHNVTEQRSYIDDNNNNLNPNHTLFSHNNHNHQNFTDVNNIPKDINHQTLRNFDNNNVSPSNITPTVPTTTPILNTGINNNNATFVPSSEIPTTQHHKKERRKNKIIKDKNTLHLPEKHHHYIDGYTSSSSESSNEGEKERALEKGNELTNYEHHTGQHGSHYSNEHPKDNYNNDIRNI